MIMEFFDAVQHRRSIRKYQNKPISPEILSKLYQALQSAPSANNRQPYWFYFIFDFETRREIVTKACHQEFIMEAPVIMAACCEPGHAFDAAIAVDHLVLAATDQGLGTCWVGWFERDAVKKILKLPEASEVPILIPIGYPAEDPEPRPRKTVADIVVTV